MDRGRNAVAGRTGDAYRAGIGAGEGGGAKTLFLHRAPDQGRFGIFLGQGEGVELADGVVVLGKNLILHDKGKRYQEYFDE